MPVPTSGSSLLKYTHPPETKEDLDWADREPILSPSIHVAYLSLVATIDLSLYSTPEGRAQLAQTLIEAVRTKGFFYVINFAGISQERIDRQYAIGQAFYDLPLDEKEKYTPDLDHGQYNGYRPAGRRINAGGLRDQVEVYNIPSKLWNLPKD